MAPPFCPKAAHAQKSNALKCSFMMSLLILHILRGHSLAVNGYSIKETGRISGAEMATIIKTAKSAEALEQNDRQVRETVENIIGAVRQRGDAAVREYSATFDKWSPSAFRLSDGELKDLVASVPR